MNMNMKIVIIELVNFVVLILYVLTVHKIFEEFENKFIIAFAGGIIGTWISIKLRKSLYE